MAMLPSVPAGVPSVDAWCINTLAHASPSGCGEDVITYECEPGPYGADGGCAEMGTDGGAALVYPAGCVSRLPGCTAAFLPSSPITCTCQTDPTFGGGFNWYCPL
jgi:hypothetical protein